VSARAPASCHERAPVIERRYGACMPPEDAPTLPKPAHRWRSPANYYAVLFWMVVIVAVIVFVWHPWHTS
jgi:hypothetical protein